MSVAFAAEAAATSGAEPPVPPSGRRLELTSSWTSGELFVYSPLITACLRTLIARYPQGATLESLAIDIMNGALQLWVMLNGEDFKGIVLTEIKRVEATGHRAVCIVGLAGEDGIELSSHIEEIEKWAWDQDADCVLAVGRTGWTKSLGKLGYAVDRITYRKDRP